MRKLTGKNVNDICAKLKYPSTEARTTEFTGHLNSVIKEPPWNMCVIQGVSGGKVNILGRYGIGHSEQKLCVYMSPIPNGFREFIFN
jgi:hypothetical protein